MWIGACMSTVGTWMQIVAQAWLIYSLSHSKFLLALDQVLGTLPIILFSLIGGVVADRFERRHVLSGSQYVQMLCALFLTVMVALHTIRVWQMLACSLISGFAQAFGGPAYSALIPTLVDKEDMPNAIALNSMQFNAAVVLGPAIAAPVLAKFGEVWCFGLNTVSFIAPVVALAMLNVRFAPGKTAETVLDSMKEGIKFVRRQGAMAGLIILGFLMTFLFIPTRTFLPVFAKDIFHRGPGTYAMFQSITGMGSIVGALTVAGFGNMRRKGRVALVALAVLGLTAAVFAVSRSLLVSYAALFFSGAAMMAVFASVSSLVQLIVTNDMRGRVMSVYNLSFRVGMMMGNLMSGWLVPILTAPVVVCANGLLLIVLAGYFALFQRRVAEL
jgi:MFS family permease